MTYREEEKKKQVERLFKLLKNKPTFYKDYMMNLTGDSSTSTKCAYAYNADIFFQWMIDSNPMLQTKRIRDITLDDLTALTPLDVNEFVVTISATRKTKTVNQIVASVSSMYKELMRFNKIANNPFSIVKRIKESEQAIIYLTDSEYRTLMNTVKYGTGLTDRELKFHHPVRDIALFSLFLDTGCRVSEIVGIDVRDFEFDEHRVLITRKGGKSTYVWFSDTTEDLLLEYEKYRLTTLLKPQDLEEAFFLNQRGTRKSIRSIEQLLEKYVNAAGFSKHISPHKLRSSYAMHLLEVTGNISLVQTALDHKNIQTSQVYARASKTQVRDLRNTKLFE